eukprot:TRINITY_DN6513_c0_g1_i1.p1 TRINITY_DN6513_c0_g1~~TRINITY_DN6513_c0_g1_i1.p1  ORF type:complete len:359 (-),score=46.57 TRINITY_DN6513_c0_g1_i1:3-1079(-)
MERDDISEKRPFFLFGYFSDLSIRYKQAIIIVLSEIVTIGVLFLVQALLLSSGLNEIVANTAKAEVKVLQVEYNFKIDRLKLGSIIQLNNSLIPRFCSLATSLNLTSNLTTIPGDPEYENLYRSFQSTLSGLLNSLSIQFATIISSTDPPVIIANGGSIDRRYEIWDPNKIFSTVIKQGTQNYTSTVIRLSELTAERPSYSTIYRNIELIRYIVTPDITVQDLPESRCYLVMGDVVTSEHLESGYDILSDEAGYLGIYLRDPLTRMINLSQSLLYQNTYRVSQLLFANYDTLLESSITGSQSFVSSIAGDTFAMSVIPLQDILSDDLNVVGFLVRGHNRASLSNLLKDTLLYLSLIHI